jgi:molybdopterin/thiamine biosynthesis adenylyltransferase
LTGEQIERFSRQILLPEVGKSGQERWLAAAVRVEVGRDPAAEHVALAYLAAAGIGRLVLFDAAQTPIAREEAELGLLFGPTDVGGDRTATLATRLEALSPELRVTTGGEGSQWVAPPFDEKSPSLAEGLWRGSGLALDILERVQKAP